MTDEAAASAWGLRHLWSFFGALLLLAWLPFYAFVSLIGPEWSVWPSLLVWVGFSFLLVRWFRPHPVRAFLVGVVAIALWHAVGLGADALGWNA